MDEPETQDTLNRESHERGQRIHDMNQTVLHAEEASWPLIKQVMWDTHGNDFRLIETLSQKDVNYLCEQINHRSSPEMIHCDGEISAAEADMRWKAVNALALELKVYCRMSGLRMKELYEIEL